MFLLMNPPLLDIKNLTKQYGSLTAVEDLSLQVPRGEIFALLGPNGAGKTTMISCVCGLIQQFSGSIRVAGLDVRRQYRLTRQVVGVVPQELNFDAFCNARQTLLYQGGMFGRRDAARRADELLEVFDLSSKAEENTRRLSGGMKRRLMVCKALMHQPALLFLDEPTAGVDVELREELWQYVRSLREEGMTIVLTTHYLEEAEELADRIGILNKGRLILVEDTQKLLNRYGSRWLQIRCRQRIPQSLVRELAALDPQSIDEYTLRLTYLDSGQDPTPVEVILDKTHQFGLSVVSAEGGGSSLETIFRQILQDDNQSPSNVQTPLTQNEEPTTVNP